MTITDNILEIKYTWPMDTSAASKTNIADGVNALNSDKTSTMEICFNRWS
jgi:hypothetical protein